MFCLFHPETGKEIRSIQLILSKTKNTYDLLLPACYKRQPKQRPHPVSLPVFRRNVASQACSYPFHQAQTNAPFSLLSGLERLKQEIGQEFTGSARVVFNNFLRPRGSGRQKRSCGTQCCNVLYEDERKSPGTPPQAACNGSGGGASLDIDLTRKNSLPGSAPVK